MMKYQEREANIKTLEEVYDQFYPPELEGNRWFVRRGSMRVFVYEYEDTVHRVGMIYQGSFSQFRVSYNETY